MAHLSAGQHWLVPDPGPNSLLALTHGALYGARRTLYTIVGGVFGFSALIALAMFGLSALLHTSASLLQVLKWVGGAYLLWLGIQLWRSPAMRLELAEGTTRLGNRGLFRQGFLSAMANPKVLLFYGAFCRSSSTLNAGWRCSS